MNRIVCFIALCSLFFAAGDRLVAQTPKNPILFVTVVPNVQDSATQSAMFGNHLSGVRNALRGGDLWVRYPDGTRKNLTKTAGFGTEGLQGETSIAVREPSVHWNGTKAVFSMIVGAPVTAADTGKQYYWQMYEITGLGATETPVITKVPNQPAANNISPAYGTDGRILFISDRPRIGYEDVAYRYLDENIAMPSNSGLWSLNPMTGDIKHLDHSPSGDFNPTVDSYGRVIFTRWDILQQDRLTFQVRGNVISMPFNHTDEGDQSPRSPVSSGSSAAFPEENPDSRLGGSGGYFDPPTGDPIVGGGSENSGIDPRLPNDFFPWAINEDGSEAQTVNHIGRHDVRDTIPSADFMTSSGVKGLSFFRASQSNRANKNPIVNAMHIKEDPRKPGTFYAIDGVNALTHTGGQIIRLNNLAPTDASNAVTVDYITPRSTRFPTPAAKVPPVDHSGFFRNPLPTTDGLLIASHTNTKVVDTPLKNGMISTASNYNFRLVTMKQSIGTTMTPDVLLTPGLKANISYTYFINGARLTQQFNGTLWEMDAVELVSRNTPAKREAVMDEQERSIFAEERVDINTFKRYLEANDRALIISRDVTMRDKDDRLQPFNLRVTGTQKQSPPAQAGSAPLTEVSDVLFFQADYIRSYADVLNPTTAPFRRIQPVKMHDVMNREFSTVLPTTPKSSSVKIQKDGSFAAFVPAHRAISWQLNNTQGSAVVRERYWLNFKAGEIRACVKCHGENQSASALYSPTPTNKPEALRGLLGVWKQDNYPKRIQQTVPLHQSLNVSFPVQLEWMPDTRAKKYEVTLRAVEGSGSRIVYTRIVDAPVTTLTVGQNELAGTSAAQYTWDVRGVGEWGVSETIQPFTFSTNSVLSVGDGGDSPELSVSPNPASSEVRVRFPVSEPQTVTLVMVDMIGRDVITSSLAATGDVDTRIPADQLPNGIYTLRVVQTHGEYRKRIVITR